MGVASAFSTRVQPARDPRQTRRDRARERRRLAEQDRRSERLAELMSIRELLVAAACLVDRGWLQHAWFSYRGVDGGVRVSYVLDRRRAGDRPALASCLVAAVRDASGVSGTGEQVTRRALELLWHTLSGDSGEPVRWCPPPDVHAFHVRDLTRWNDHPGRTTAEVTSLLHAAAAAADVGRRRISAH